MKLTRACGYALHALVSLARQESEQPVASHLVANNQGIPGRFLLKVLKPLVSAGVLQSTKGPNGGYKLTRSPSKITLLEVVEAVDGPVRGEVDFLDPAVSRPLDDRLQAVCGKVADAVRSQLQKIRLSELAGSPAG
jgi:Rrf2 family protein